jgi:hypothetical protein
VAWGSGGIAPRLFKVGSGQFHFPRALQIGKNPMYTQGRRLGGVLRQCGICGEEKPVGKRRHPICSSHSVSNDGFEDYILPILDYIKYTGPLHLLPFEWLEFTDLYIKIRRLRPIG